MENNFVIHGWKISVQILKDNKEKIINKKKNIEKKKIPPYVKKENKKIRTTVFVDNLIETVKDVTKKRYSREKRMKTEEEKKSYPDEGVKKVKKTLKSHYMYYESTNEKDNNKFKVVVKLLREGERVFCKENVNLTDFVGAGAWSLVFKIGSDSPFINDIKEYSVYDENVKNLVLKCM